MRHYLHYVLVEMSLNFSLVLKSYKYSLSHNCRRAQKPQNCITTVNNITYDDVITRTESDRKQNSATCSSQTKLYEDQKRLSSKTEESDTRIYVG